jgi:hypothetical protein
MKTKKTVIAVLAAMLVITIALIVGCIEPQDVVSVVKPDIEDNYQIPEGKGIVRFKISDSDARTILPDNTATGLLLSAMFFDIKFTTNPGGTASYYPKEGDGSAAPTVKVIHGSINNVAISLPAGDYDVLITAYAEADGTTPIAGWTSTTSITITSGVNNPTAINANLIGFTNGSKTGTFIPNINIPAASYNANLNIKGYGNAQDINIPLTNSATFSTSQTLPSGYYIVTISLSQSHYQTRQYIYALHIYPAMSSKMPALTGLPSSLTQNEFEVAFEVGSEPLDNDTDIPASKWYGYGNLIDVDDPEPTNLSMGFGGWYTDSMFTTFWNKNTSRVKTTGVTLYANYVASGTPGSNPFNITFTITDQAGTSVVTSDVYSISRDDFTSGATGSAIVIELDGTWDTVLWSVSGLDNAVVDNHTSSNILYINNSSDFWPALAGGSFDVTLRSAIKGGAPYTPDPPNNSVTITVTD